MVQELRTVVRGNFANWKRDSSGKTPKPGRYLSSRLGSIGVSPTQVGTEDASPAKVSEAQVGSAQVGPVQVGFGKVGAAQIGPLTISVRSGCAN